MNAGPSEVSRAQADIDEEVSQLRTSGRVSAGFVERLEQRFDAYLPEPATTGTPLRRSLALTDAAIALDEAVPLGSRLPGGNLVKRAVHRLVGWYVRFFVAQLHRGLWGLARSVHALVEAVEQLQDKLDTGLAADGLLLSETPGTDPAGGTWWWTSLADQALSSAGDAVVRESTGEAVAADELRRRSAQTLRGVLVHASAISGTVGDRARLVQLAASRLTEGGVLIVASPTPQARSRSSSAVSDDLSGSRPLHAQTWVLLLEKSGFEDIAVHHGGRDLRVTEELAVDAGQATETIRGLTATVNALVGGPDEYLVVARRP